MASLPPVLFVKYFDKGSTILGGEQVATALCERGVESRTIAAGELDGVRGAILVFIKKGRLDHLLAARRRGNVSILDVQDTLALKRRLKNHLLFDGVIYRSQKPLDDYGRPGKRNARIYLQWNPNYRPNEVGAREFRLAYLGDPRSFAHWDRLPGVPCISEEHFFAEAVRYNCHISIRVPRREALYKPTCKVATAAACEANLITTRDAASVEVLGEDYPYYTGADPESINRVIAYARETFGGPVWERGLAKMREVRESHRLERVVDQYERYLEGFPRRATLRGGVSQASLG